MFGLFSIQKTMKTWINIKSATTKLLVVFLVLGQFSNLLLVSDLYVSKENIVLNSDFDNNSKEDKNELDVELEIKILESFHPPFPHLSVSNRSDLIVQKFTEVTHSKDFPPPEFIWI